MRNVGAISAIFLGRMTILLQRVLALPPFLRCAAAAFDELKIVIKLRLLSLHLKIIIINNA